MADDIQPHDPMVDAGMNGGDNCPVEAEVGGGYENPVDGENIDGEAVPIQVFTCEKPLTKYQACSNAVVLSFSFTSSFNTLLYNMLLFIFYPIFVLMCCNFILFFW